MRQVLVLTEISIYVSKRTGNLHTYVTTFRDPKLGHAESEPDSEYKANRSWISSLLQYIPKLTSTETGNRFGIVMCFRDQRQDSDW